MKLANRLFYPVCFVISLIVFYNVSELYIGNFVHAEGFQQWYYAFGMMIYFMSHTIGETVGTFFKPKKENLEVQND